MILSVIFQPGIKVNITIGKHEVSPTGLIVILVALTWLCYGAFFAPAGLFTDDEIIYVAMIDRFATAGSFVIENGYDFNQAESLRLVTMRAGPHGLVSQYPSGFAVIAAPFYLLGGLQGVIFGLATFAVDYAFAIWPHATSNLFVAGVIYCKFPLGWLGVYSENGRLLFNTRIFQQHLVVIPVTKTNVYLDGALHCHFITDIDSLPGLGYQDVVRCCPCSVL
jgi:hypothetical protein